MEIRYAFTITYIIYNYIYVFELNKGVIGFAKYFLAIKIMSRCRLFKYKIYNILAL